MKNDDMMIWGTLAVLILATIGLMYVIVAVYRYLSARGKPPVIRVCRFGRRVGVVSRKAFDSASHELWESVDAGISNLGRPKMIRIDPVFVFSEDDSQLEERIFSRCRVEEAVFYVPHVSWIDEPGNVIHRCENYLGLDISHPRTKPSLGVSGLQTD